MKKSSVYLAVGILVIGAVLGAVIFREQPVLKDPGSAQLHYVQVNVGGAFGGVLDYVPEGSYDKEAILAALSEGKMRWSLDTVSSYAQGDVEYAIYVSDDSSGDTLSILLGDLNQVRVAGKKTGYKILNPEDVIEKLNAEKLDPKESGPEKTE